jgi:hypothetical protein
MPNGFVAFQKGLVIDETLCWNQNADSWSSEFGTAHPHLAISLRPSGLAVRYLFALFLGALASLRVSSSRSLQSLSTRPATISASCWPGSIDL